MEDFRRRILATGQNNSLIKFDVSSRVHHKQDCKAEKLETVNDTANLLPPVATILRQKIARTLLW